MHRQVLSKFVCEAFKLPRKLSIRAAIVCSCLHEAGTLAQVSEAGDVLWALPPNFRSIILGKSWLLRLEPVLAGARNAAGYLVRVSFGTTLVASIVLVTLTIIAVLTAAQSSERDDRRCGFCAAMRFYCLLTFYM